MSDGRAVSVLLARGGSKGVPGKNLRTVGGVTLVARSVIAARQATRLCGIYVSTDDAVIAAEASAFGATVIGRPADLSGDTASSESGWLHALGIIRQQIPDVDTLVLLQCTSPFTTGADIDGCLAAMERAEAACSLSVYEDLPFLWTVDANGLARGANHDETQQRPRRQDLGPHYRESGAIYCVRAADFERVGRRFCGAVALFEVDHPPIEIDTLDELKLCDAIARHRPGPSQPAALDQRLVRVRAIVTDFDGVHTDDLVHVDQNGVESVTVSRRDGMGMEMLRKDGRWKLFILSKERNPVVMRRAEKLNIECLNATEDKVAALEAWLDTTGLGWDDVLYVGNDLNDIDVLKRVGVAVCPKDADPKVQAVCHWIVPVNGGRGVLRAIADHLL